MKNLFALLLALVMVFSLAACGGNGEKPPDGGNDTPGTSQQEPDDSTKDNPPPEGSDAEFTIYVNGSEEWTPFPGKSGVTFAVADEDLISVSDNGAKISFTGKQVGETVITATLGSTECEALVRVQEMEATIPIEFMSVEESAGKDGNTVQIYLRLEPTSGQRNFGLMTDEVIITPNGAIGDYIVQYVDNPNTSHVIVLGLIPSEEQTITVSFEKDGYTFSPEAREVTIYPVGDRE